MARPTWSTGCHACRKMKKKCDGAKPECTRCKKAARQCPGYRSDDQFIFRSMNDSAMARTNRPTMLSTISSVDHQFFIQPSTDWAQFAISRFVFHFVEPPSVHGLPGYLEFLPTMLNSADKSLQTSLLAVSMASLANVCGIEALHTEARVQYGRALRSLHSTLLDKSNAGNDHTLLAIVLLQKYETITGNIDLAKDPHEKATNEIMQLRRADQESLSSRSSSLSRVVIIRKEINAMEDRTENPSDVGSRDIDAKQSIGGSLRTSLRDVYIASRRLQVCTNIQEGPTDSQMDASTKAWRFAANLYDRLMLWPSTLPPAWKMKAHVLQTTPSYMEGLTNDKGQVYTFSSLQHGAIYIAYQCSRIHLCQSMQKARRSMYQQWGISLPDSAFTPPDDDISAALSSSVDEVFGIGSFMLGDVSPEGRINTSSERRALGAFFLLRGVHVALSVDTLSQRQRLKILDLLHRIGTEFGIKVASRRREKWLVEHPEWI